MDTIASLEGSSYLDPADRIGQTVRRFLPDFPNTWRFAGAASLLGVALLLVGCAPALLEESRIALSVFVVGVSGSLFAQRAAAGVPARAVWAAILLLRVIGLLGEPTLSDDIHRYVHEGRASRLGLAVPYAVPPAEIVPPPDDGTTARVNHPEVPAAYPPTTQLFFLATVAVGDALGAPRAPLRALLVVLDLFVVLALYRRRRDAPLAYARYGLHVLPLLEVAVGAHVDALGVGLLAAGLVLAFRPSLCGFLVGLAAGVKPIALFGVLGVPMRTGRLLGFLAGTLLGVALPTLPYVVVGAPMFSGLVEYSTRWEAQPTLYALVEGALSPPFEARKARGLWAHLHVTTGPFGFLVEEGGAPRLELGAARMAERPFLLDKRFFARLLSLALVALACGLLLLREADPLRRVAWVLAAFWLLSPTLHPWYLLWPLPFAALTGSRALLLFAAASPLAYEAALRAQATGVWEESLVPRVVMLGAIVVGLLLDRGQKP